jgi:hypothetical protein
MAKKIAKQELPKTEEGLDSVAVSVIEHASAPIQAEDPKWKDISPVLWTAFLDAHADWTPAYAACKVAHLPKDTEKKNLAEKALRKSLTDLLDRGFLLDPRTAEDAVAMGFELIDPTHTVPTEVTDTVDMDRITNGPIPGSHTHVINYRIDGSTHRAKAPYHMAVFQVYIKNADDPAPSLHNDQGWSKDYVNLTEPFEMVHKDEDANKIAYYRAHWEAHGGLKGKWAMASARIP